MNIIKKIFFTLTSPMAVKVYKYSMIGLCIFKLMLCGGRSKQQNYTSSFYSGRNEWGSNGWGSNGWAPDCGVL